MRQVISSLVVCVLVVGCGGGGAVAASPSSAASAPPASARAADASPSRASAAPPTSAAWSPRPAGLPAPFGVARNGSLAWDADGDIYTADPTGQHAVAVVTGPENDVDPAWSDDGTRFAFLRVAAGNTTRLMVAAADGTGVVSLTGIVAGVDWYDWSPDDAQLAIHHLIDGVPSISIVAADGSGSIKTLDLGDIEPSGQVDWRPPDGRELIFTGHVAGSSSMGLYAIAPDGTGLRTVGAVSTSDAWFNDFEMSPDGSTVGYWAWGRTVPASSTGGRTCATWTRGGIGSSSCTAIRVSRRTAGRSSAWQPTWSSGRPMEARPSGRCTPVSLRAGTTSHPTARRSCWSRAIRA